MIVLTGLVLGIFWGIRTARARGGNRLDMAQYAAVFGILFALVALFVTIAVERML